MNHDRYDDSYISGILNSVRTIAIVGASPNDVRPSFFVLKYLLAKGFAGFPGQSRPCRQGDPRPQGLCAGSPTFPRPIDMVEIFRASDAVPGIVDEVAGDEAAAEGRLDAARRAQ